jgi:hypothetical protein
VTATVTAIKRQTEKAEGVRTQWQVVTPDLATKWLEGNTHNRGVRDSVVQRYAVDMKAGRWKQTHQGIAFDEDGVLIDGQHRLFAVIDASVPVLMQVTYNLPLDTQTVVDDHIKRSVLDVLKVNNAAMANLTAFHCAVSERMRLGLNPRASVSTQTRQERGEFLARHWEAVDFAVGCFPTRRRVRGVVSAAPVSVVARAFYHEDRAGLVRFSQVLLDGVNRSESESVIIVLRNWLLTRKSVSGDDAAREAYGKTARALVAYVKGEALKTGKLYAVTEDPYPLPVKNGGKLR